MQTCHTSQSCGARDHRKNKPLRHGEEGEGADVIQQPSPAVWGTSSWLTLEDNQCARSSNVCAKQMSGIPQGIFDPHPANPEGSASTWSICTARCQIND